MTIPDFQSVMLPLMQVAGDGKEHSLREAIEYLAQHFKLTESERKELLPSGKQAVFDNRVGWARTYLKKAGLLESPRRSIFQITSRGIEVLKSKPDTINMNLLKQFPEYLEFAGINKNGVDELSSKIELVGGGKTASQNTPREVLEYAYQELRQTLAQDLLVKIKNCIPRFFEQLVVDLLVKMGYGGSIKEAGQAVGKSGDEGIDGIIKEDRLGLDVIYIQAKRWNDTVGRPEIQRFIGALAGQGAKKGIFITTSSFSDKAREFAPKNDTKIVLIDGEQLTQYMIDFNLGISIVSEYQIKEIDSDYFEGEQ